jgi:hypothetical protein
LKGKVRQCEDEEKRRTLFIQFSSDHAGDEKFEVVLEASAPAIPRTIDEHAKVGTNTWTRDLA